MDHETQTHCGTQTHCIGKPHAKHVLASLKFPLDNKVHHAAQVALMDNVALCLVLHTEFGHKGRDELRVLALFGKTTTPVNSSNSSTREPTDMSLARQT